MTFVDGPVEVTVPATSANLGPGYDALGLAVGLRDRLVGRIAGVGTVVEVSGEGAAEVPRDQTHLVVRAMHLAFDEMGERPPGLRLTCHNSIPHARGLGSSSAAIVGGIALARGLVAGGSLLLDDDAAFRLAAGLEGHPDNVAPAWYGGFVVSGRDDDGAFWAVPSSVDPRVSAVAFVPPSRVSTEEARRLLPATVPHADAAANAGRAALLVSALAGRPEHLLRATRDLLHQDYRRPAMPASLDLVESLRTRGIAAVVSGAGPSVLAMCAECDVDTLVAAAPDGWRALPLEVERHGVRVSS
ncbi:homoserine kinase [Nocardioides sp. GXQ0305]|uniref:homoserine kinase n=1 Tax=Nocardioides sp. GXQ0305 TaxID=3423912 RepID=UPI003D7DD3EE